MAKVKTTADKVTKRVDDVKIKSLGIWSADFDNNYFQRTIDIANDSGTAQSCLKVYRRFVSGIGFTEPLLGSIRLNREGLTADKLRQKVVKSLGDHGGVAIHFNYNGLGQKVEINFLPFKFCRLTLEENKLYPNRIAVYDDWDCKLNKSVESKKVKYIHKYDPSAVLEQVNAIEIDEKGKSETEILEEKFSLYEGQVFYWTPEGNNEYPLCPFDSVLEDMITEAQTKRFKTNTSARNFLASHFVITGKSEVELDEDGNPVDNTGEGFGDVLKQFQGGDGSGLMVHIEKDHNEEPFEIKKVEIQNYDGLYQYTEDSSTDDIIRQFMIPPILLVRQAGSLGSSKEIFEASEYYNDITSYDREVVSMIIKECLDGYIGDMGITDFTIKPLSYKKPIEADSFSYYSKNEIRESQGHEAVEDTESDKQILAVTLGVGGTQALTGIISDPVLTIEQKKGTIQVLFGMNEEDVNKLLGL